MISYYDNANGIKQVSPCMRITDICEGLDKENLPALKKELLLKICAHADLIVEQGNYCFSHEVSCTQGLFLGKIDLLCQTYLLTGKEKYLSLRQFDEEDARTVYEQQQGICPICGQHFDFEKMHADHIKPWHAGGKTVPENLQMLCRDCNLKKSRQE